MDYLKIDVLGFYTLRRLQIDDTQASFFTDIDLLLVASEDWSP